MFAVLTKISHKPFTFPKWGKGDHSWVPGNALARFWGSGVVVDEDVNCF